MAHQGHDHTAAAVPEHDPLDTVAAVASSLRAIWLLGTGAPDLPTTVDSPAYTFGKLAEVLANELDQAYAALLEAQGNATPVP